MFIAFLLRNGVNSNKVGKGNNLCTFKGLPYKGVLVGTPGGDCAATLPTPGGLSQTTTPSASTYHPITLQWLLLAERASIPAKKKILELKY